MPEEEFNLSEKIIEGKDIHNGEAEFVNTFMIKEFIKRVEKIFAYDKMGVIMFRRLVGDKLHKR